MFDELIFKWLTDEQREFVEDFDNSILVSASAGTGKTTTMIRKILYLLLVKKIDITKLLVVTYTTSAASKMKHDLYNGLQNALNIAVNDEDMFQHINKQIDLLNNADIGTIHSFCNKIIKRYFYKLGIDPNYSILSNEKSKSYLMNRSINEVFEKNNIQENEEFFKIYEMFNSDRTDSRLRLAILSLYEYLICRINEEKWFNQTINDSYINDNTNIVWKYLLDFYKEKIYKIKNKLNLCYELADASSCEKAKAFCVARLDVVDKLMNSSTVFEFANILKNEKVPNKPTIKTDKDFTLIEVAEMVEYLSEEYRNFKAEADKIFEVFLRDSFQEENIENKKNSQVLYNLCKEVSANFNKIKEENNLLDFNDLESLAIKLCEDESVLKELKEDYSFIFVDEYQDVNYLQDSIVESISKSNNLYMIGDVKQSIYRFRQSSPEIFLQKYNDYKLGVDDKKLILFNKNFRSASKILGFVNNIFDNAITKECIGIDYINEARLVSGKEDSNGVVEMTLLDVADIIENSQNIDEEVSKREYEAKLIAMKVAEVVSKGKYNFRDIAILLRDKKELTKNVWIALKKLNIPVSVIIKNNIFTSNEVIVLLSLLKCVYNEDDDISFVTLLKSPIINLSNDDLVDIRLTSPDAVTFYEACLVAETNLANIGEKITKLRNMLKAFRFDCLDNSIGEVLRKFVLEHSLDIYYKSMPDGIEKESNINEFLTIVDSQVYENSLPRLLDYIDIIKEKDTEISVSGGNDSVTLMTMHSSKGLDFPVVIVGGFGESISKNVSNDLNINKDFGIACQSVEEQNYIKTPNVNSIAIKLKNKKEEFEESVRLMYVALTRPKERLYITGVVDSKKVCKKPIFECQSYFDIYIKSVNNVDLNFFINKKQEFTLSYDNTVVNCEYVDVKALDFSADSSQVILDVSDPTIVNKLKVYFAKKDDKYPNIAFKNSVTNILKEQEIDYSNILEKFKKMELKDSLKSSEAMLLGTQYHIIMQNLDYKNDKEDIKALINNLVFANKINAIYLPKIDLNKIENAKAKIKELLTDNCVIGKEVNFLTLAPHCELIDGSSVEEKVLVQGVIDFYIETPKGAIIVDFKTNRTNSKEYLIETYKTQLNLYSKAFEFAKSKKVVKKYLYSFEMNELIEVE